MNADLEQYKKLLMEDMNLFAGHMFSKVITFDEYQEFNKVASAIEEILEAKYGEDVINKVRLAQASKANDMKITYKEFMERLNRLQDEGKLDASIKYDLFDLGEALHQEGFERGVKIGREIEKG